MPSRSRNHGRMSPAWPPPAPKPLSITSLKPHGIETVDAAATIKASAAAAMCNLYLVAKLQIIRKLRIERPLGRVAALAMVPPNSRTAPPQLPHCGVCTATLACKGSQCGPHRFFPRTDLRFDALRRL